MGEYEKKMHSPITIDVLITKVTIIVVFLGMYIRIINNEWYDFCQVNMIKEYIELILL